MNRSNRIDCRGANREFTSHQRPGDLIMSVLARASLLFIAAFGLATVAQSAQSIDVPVMITADDHDACANGEINGLDPKETVSCQSVAAPVVNHSMR
jgi:hypothetical protein